MPQCSTAVNPKGIRIKFTESDHKYTSIVNGHEIGYTSVTTFIGSFFPVFDPTGRITEDCAKRDGITVEELKKRWREKANNSCRFGTIIHESCEDTLKGNSLRNTNVVDPLWKAKQKTAIDTARKVLERSDILGIEKIVFDPDLRISGTIDLLVRSKKDGRIYICDWKTNERIDTENKYKEFGRDPIRHIPAVNFHEYAMQLNMYEYLLKYGNYIDRNENVGKVLFHITENGMKSYVLPDYQKEIVDMIEYRNRHPLPSKR